jgi:putative colanic acid biosynthesis UDP-glucose lipid carrier transferase
LIHQGYLRRNQRLVNLLQILLDIVAIAACLFFAYHYHHSAAIPVPYLVLMVLAPILFYLVSINTRLYTSWRTGQNARHLAVVLETWFITLFCLAVLGWALKTTSFYSRMVLGIWLVATPLLLGLGRLLVHGTLRYLRRQGRNSRNVAIVGGGQSALELARELRSNEWMGYLLGGYYHTEAVPGMEDVEYCGNFPHVVDDVKKCGYDEVFIALPMTEEATIASLVDSLSDRSIPVHIIPETFFYRLMHAQMRWVGSIPAISVYDSPHDDLSAAWKRAEDILLSLLILLLVAPLMIVLAMAIKLTSRGPVLFRQRRYGIGGEEITVWKFRSMTVCEDGAEIRQAGREDTRVTPLGRFMRRHSLDELPQFFNVLQGRMSIVGPRPHAVAHNEIYRKSIPGYMLRHLVKPGITGWAQVNGWRGETDTLDKMEKRVEYDLEYIRNWSILFDLKIILMTIASGFSGKNAY